MVRRAEDRVPTAEDIDQNVEPRHREAMLDLVLAWGDLDNALGQLLTVVAGLEMIEGARRIGRMPSQLKLEAIRRLLIALPNGGPAAAIVKRHKRLFEKHSRPRDHVAHSKLAGVWKSDRDFLVFLKFAEQDGGLVMDRVPIQEMQRATRWGHAFTAMVVKIVDQADGYANSDAVS